MNESDRVFAKVARRLIPLMVCLYTISFLDRVNIGFAALTMNADLGFTPEIYGWGASIFFLGYFLFEVPSNVILARVGARRWICRIMVTWGLISGAMAFVQTPMSFYVLRFLLGLAEAGFAPGMIFYLSLWFPAAVRARYAASYFIAVPLATVIGGPLSSAILNLDGVLGFQGWQWLFVIEALPALVFAIIVLFYLPDGPRDAKWLTPQERETILARLESERPHSHHPVGDVWKALVDIRVLLFCAIYFGIVVGLYGVTFWLPLIVNTMGFSTSATGYVVAIPYAITVVAMIAWGRHSDASQERVWHLALPTLLTAAAFGISAVAQSPAIVLVALSVAAIGVCSTLAPFWAMPPLFLSGAGAAAGIALINAVGNLGGMLGPYAVGFAVQRTGGYAGGMAVLAVSCALAAILVLTMGRFKCFAFARR
ncbi:MAG: MFS transporter [Alphaproteobacteria bacterium]|nr:MFS transporter [Alphaproteobacteria bacterium]